MSVLDRFINVIPASTPGEPEDLDARAVSLASEASRIMAGASMAAAGCDNPTYRFGDQPMPDSRSSPKTSGPLPPVQLAALFADFVDVLIPGDAKWPSASAIGVQGLLLSRLVEERGEAEPHLIAEALLTAGAPFTGQDAAGRRAIVERLEATHAELFAQLRTAVTLAYYESPLVAEAIRALGRPYLLRPHLVGYPSRPFDAARDTPAHGRGRYLATDAVTRVDISSLDLETTRTEAWGINR